MEKAAACFRENEMIIEKYCDNEYDAAEGADAVILFTEWNQFRSLDLDRMKTGMAGSYFFDLRNIYSDRMMTDMGFRYYSVGRG
jgi:UDPglucose 6-dehydrogenase